MFSLRWLLYIFILLTNGKNIHASFSTECNPVYCFSVLDSLFDVNEEDSCLKLTKLLKCATPCLASGSENILIKALKVMESFLCSDQRYQEDSINVNKCLSSQKYAIFSCFYKFYNSEADDPQVDPKFLNCRIYLDVGMCDSFAAKCTSRASYISESLLRDFYTSFIPECAGIAGEDLQDIRLKKSHFKEYELLAECLDKNRNLVTQCFSKAVADLSLKPSKNLCRMNAASQCIENIVLNNCDSRLDIFRNISQSLTNRLTPVCSNSDFAESLEYQNSENSKIATTLLTKELSDPPKTEKVTEHAESSTFHSFFSSDNPTKDLSTSGNDYKFYSRDEINSDFSKRLLQNATFPVNITGSSNSTPPIVIHKHIVMTVSYRAKSDADSVSVVLSLIGVLFIIQYLSTRVLIE